MLVSSFESASTHKTETKDKYIPDLLILPPIKLYEVSKLRLTAVIFTANHKIRIKCSNGFNIAGPKIEKEYYDFLTLIRISWCLMYTLFCRKNKVET